MTDSELYDAVRAFLHTWRTASLATVDEQGHAHAANVQFAVDERLHLIFVSSDSAAHSRHLARDPQAAMTVYAHTDEDAGAAAIHGVQLHGRCARIDGADARQHAWNVYSRRFTFIADNHVLAQRVKQEQFYRFIPTWLRWIDNRRGFGFKKEMRLEA